MTYRIGTRFLFGDYQSRDIENSSSLDRNKNQFLIKKVFHSTPFDNLTPEEKECKRSKSTMLQNRKDNAICLSGQQQLLQGQNRPFRTLQPVDYEIQGSLGTN